jgi:hypothetical protein
MPIGVRAKEPVLAELPWRWFHAIRSDRRRQDVAEAEVASSLLLAAKPDPGVKIGVVVGLASERLQPVPVVRLLTVKIRQPSHEFTFGVGMSFIPYPLVLTPVV